MDNKEQPSGAPEDGSATEPKSGAAIFVEWATKWKEVALLFVFIVGGAIWVYTVFVTQTQLERLRCSLDLAIAVVAGQVAEKVAQDELATAKDDVSRLAGVKNLTAQDRKRLEELKIERDQWLEKLKVATNNNIQLSTKITSTSCNG